MKSWLKDVSPEAREEIVSAFAEGFYKFYANPKNEAYFQAVMKEAEQQKEGKKPHATENQGR